FLRVLECEAVDREEHGRQDAGALVEETAADEPHGGNRGREREHRDRTKTVDGARDLVRGPLEQRVQDLIALVAREHADEGREAAVDGRPRERFVLPETAALQSEEAERERQPRERDDRRPHATRWTGIGARRVGHRATGATPSDRYTSTVARAVASQ